MMARGICMGIHVEMIFLNQSAKTQYNIKSLFYQHLISSTLFIYAKVKPAHSVTPIKQSPVLKGHIFHVLS
jgi:hypothetical protein